MSVNRELDLMDYFTRELEYLRREGKDFGKKYPQVASRLDLRESESLDPHVERLIESFAFLSARVRRDIDRDYSQIANHVLDKFCPSLLQPIPSLTIVNLRSNERLGKLTKPLQIPRHSKLLACSDTNQVCAFRTVWDLFFVPLEIARVSFDDDENFFVHIQTIQDSDLSELVIPSLDFHINADWKMISLFQENLTNKLQGVTLLDQKGNIREYSKNNIEYKGFDEEELALPLPEGGQSAYCLLQEYFAFEKKFNFVTLKNIDLRNFSGRKLILKFNFSILPKKLRTMTQHNLMLNCVPIINLFTKISEPIKLSDKKVDQLLIADKKKDSYTEIHSIDSITISEPGGSKPKKIRDFSTVTENQDSDEEENSNLYWVARREKSLRKDITGSDIFFSIVERNLSGEIVKNATAYANLLCTNRRLCEQIPANSRFDAENISDGIQIKSLYEPTPQRDPSFDGGSIWQLTSLLTLNHYSLVAGDTGIQQIREMLSLFSTGNLRDFEQIRGIKKLVAKESVRRLRKASWRTFCTGVSVTIEVERDAFVGSSLVLFTLVLAKFFSLYTTINSFVCLSVICENEKLIEWPPMSGTQEYI
ncbi:type VI secretion system baseplate subunit TssF [Betaproteobacteria bacterium]|nr:type VI secretion system baseplate subunit TssF [Betaproteobacteria bacterium]